MESVKVLDKEFDIYIENNKIISEIEKLSVKINNDLKDKNPLFIVVLNGAFVFASELITRFNGPCEVTFVRFSSYEGTKSTNKVRELMGMTENVEGRTVVFVEDIIDTGLTMLNAKEKMLKAGAKEVFLSTLLFKPKSFKFDYKIDYVCMEIPNDFIIGFGLDYDGQARNLKHIYKIKE